MAPKALLLLLLITPFTFAWGSTHDLYVRDAIPEPNPYAYEQALAARTLAARKLYAAKARRAANGRVLLSRQINPREPKAEANAEAHAFQQYDSGLFRRDGSVIPREPYAYPGAAAFAQPDPESWLDGGELSARSYTRGDFVKEDDKGPGNKRSEDDPKDRKGQRPAKVAKRESKKDERKDGTGDENKSSTSKPEQKDEKRSTKSWFSWPKW
ncbi:MAG: hypothetical protein LQ340_007159 [Diploschistes diacapsis]|nr:MAG: hypothetical protein LQ340_007159 [Diploschistes diacapsis]